VNLSVNLSVSPYLVTFQWPIDRQIVSILAGIVEESARNPKTAAAFHQFRAERRSMAAGLVRRIADTLTSPPPGGEG
jgi:hypothetical protein